MIDRGAVERGVAIRRTEDEAGRGLAVLRGRFGARLIDRFWPSLVCVGGG